MAALEAGVGPYRLRQTGDAAWPPKERAYGGESPSLWPRLLPLALAALVLLLPVTLLSVLLAAAYLYADAVLPASSFPAPLQGVTFTIGDLVLPGAWAAVHLTNRRYGAPYAFAQLAAALAVAALVMLVNPGGIDDWVAFMPSLTTRAVLAFGVSFLAANFIAITVFDGLRGPAWWSAPLAGSIAATLVLGGALAAGQETRLYDSVVLKVLGATRAKLLLSFLYEFGIIGLATVAFGIVAGSFAALAVVKFVMKLDFVWLWPQAFAAALGALAVAVLLGIAGTFRVLGRKPAQYLRNL